MLGLLFSSLSLSLSLSLYIYIYIYIYIYVMVNKLYIYIYVMVNKHHYVALRLARAVKPTQKRSCMHNACFV